MSELFNPAGLHMLEDRHAAIAYGYVAPRVFYARFVGCVALDLGGRYVQHLEELLTTVSTLAYFADTSALESQHHAVRARFEALVKREREKISALVLLSQPSGSGPASRSFADAVGGVKLLSDPLEFERALCNVAPFPDRTAKDWAHVWQVHAPR